MKPRLLVTGGAGFLGTHLLRQATGFAAAGTLHHTPAASISGVSFHVCNILHPEEVKILLDRVSPHILIHTACSDQGQSMDSIVTAAGLLAMVTAERGIRFIHLSTDQVFDGTAAPYVEDSPPKPINPYGQAKVQAEELIGSMNPQAAIVRTSLIYDLRSPDRPTEWMIESMAASRSIRLFVDEIRCPIWCENLADALLELGTTDWSGILHIGGPQALNRWDYGLGLLRHFKIPPTEHLLRGTIDEAGLVRPKNLTLDSTRAQQLLKTPLLSLEEACRMLMSSEA